MIDKKAIEFAKQHPKLGPIFDKRGTYMWSADQAVPVLLSRFAVKDVPAENRRGVAAQTLVVLAKSSTPKEMRSGLLSIITSGLHNEGASASLLSDIVAADLKELEKYKTPNGSTASTLSTRYLLKCVDTTTLAVIAISLYSVATTAAVLASRVQTGGWASFRTQFGLSIGLITKALAAAMLAEQADVSQWCATWAAGPFATVPPGNLVDLAALANGAVATIANDDDQNEDALSTTTTNEGGSHMAIKIEQSIKPAINAVLGSAGIKFSIDEILGEVEAKAALEKTLNELGKKYSEETDELRRQLSVASRNAAQPMVVQSSVASIPSGKVEYVQAETIFPVLKGVKLEVPKFTWDSTHPHVPVVDDGYIFRKPILLETLRCLVRKENVWLQGHTGSGKTTLAEQIAARLHWPTMRVAFDSNVDRSELVGRMNLKPDGKGGTESEWLPGVLEQSMSHGFGYILILDEMDAGHPNSLYTTQPVLEGKPLTLLEDGGRVVLSKPMFRIVATGNTTGNGDPSGLYPACRILSAATLDRFPSFVHVPYMTIDEETLLLQRAAPSLTKTMIAKLAKFGHELRVSYLKLETPISYSPRRSVAFARAIEDYKSIGIADEPTILSAVFRSKLYDAAPDEYRQRITEIANSSLGGVDPTKKLD